MFADPYRLARRPKSSTLPDQNAHVSAHDDLVWSAVKRIFTFDEPDRKTSQLKKLAARLLGDQMPVPELLAHMIADNPCTRQDQLVSICLALAESLRFSSATLDLWAKRDESSQPGSSELFHDSIDSLVANKGLCDSAALWCKWVLRCKIPWTWLAAESMRDDPRIKFLAETARQFLHCGDGNELALLSTAFQMFGRGLKEHRRDLPTDFLPNGLIIVEGATELILLPHVAKCVGTPLEKQGLLMVAAGGAKQVCRRYMLLKESLLLPIVCLLDSDATEQAEQIIESLRPYDRLFLIPQGEVEDTFETPMFVGLLNAYLQSLHASANLFQSADFKIDGEVRKSEVAQRLLKQRAQIDFDKVAFAKIAVQNLQSGEDVPKELRSIMDNIVGGLTRAL
jgi:hypothetical protein